MSNTQPDRDFGLGGFMASVKGNKAEIRLKIFTDDYDAFRYITYGCYATTHIDRVVFIPPATIVFWDDGTKTVVKTSPNDKFDKEKGILWAYFLKNASGSKTQLQKEIAKYCAD